MVSLPSWFRAWSVKVRKSCISQKDRLDKLGLFHPEHQRLRRDLIEVYKILRGINRADSENLFPRVKMSKSRGHSLKVRAATFKGVVRGNFFFLHTVMGSWNTARDDGGSRYSRGI